MKLIIEDDLLKNLLVSKKSHIGTSWLQAIMNIGSGVAFILTALGIDKSSLSSKIGFNIDILFISFGLVLIAIGFYQFIMSIGPNRYDHDKLFQDILKLNKDKSQYSLVAIKNTFDKYPNKYLLYYDEDWRVEFFPAFKTVSNDLENIKDKLSESLKIERDKITLTFLTEIPNQKKFSEKRKLEKVYDHRYYQATILNFPDNLQYNSIKIEGIHYTWMTFREMRNDKNIMNKNEDIIKVFEQHTT